MKIKSTKAFKEAVNDAYDNQTNRDRAYREYEELRKLCDDQSLELAIYASKNPEVFDAGNSGRYPEGSTDRVKYKMTTGEALVRIKKDGSLNDQDWLDKLPKEYVRTKKELNRAAIKAADLSAEFLAEKLGLERVTTKNLKFRGV